MALHGPPPAIESLVATTRGRGSRSGAADDASARLHGDRGAAIVEMALMLPLVIAIALSTVTCGLAISQELDLEHAAREAARYGATLSSSQTFTDGESWAHNVRDVALDRAAGGLDVAGATVCVSLVEGSGAGGVQVVSGPFIRGAYTTQVDGSPCDASETYPTTLYDTGRRVQIRLTRPAYIETGVSEWTIGLSSNVTVKSESIG